ncbi:uncharacterized protein UV8b_01761 [Ustilaginoidea virens]|uniref:Uncharacterized protein n=1 Tax=Ustilaginoidea virens TaxID=1159556 RepID=A0A8E5HLM1_USTVR|nr:uncharacterized protein UV8b_01761 [Ustilaginoidea virens]QUC17520.1 hypothetical protein UV8b_01761 [Ustilaginoidea virens]
METCKPAMIRHLPRFVTHWKYLCKLTYSSLSLFTIVEQSQPWGHVATDDSVVNDATRFTKTVKDPVPIRNVPD